MTDSSVCLCLCMISVGQRKTREAPANSDPPAEERKPSETVGANEEKKDNLDETGKANEPEVVKKEDQKDKNSVPAAEDEKAKEMEFQVRVVGVSA